MLYELLLPYADRVAVSYAEVSTGSVSRCLGILAAMLGRWEDAERQFEDALAMNERIGARQWLAHTQRDLARMLLGRSSPGDAEKAHDLLSDARATYHELGMATHAVTATELRERAAVAMRGR
jgi:tetratricopeptide (TPR) repeat protein